MPAILVLVPVTCTSLVEYNATPNTGEGTGRIAS